MTSTRTCSDLNAEIDSLIADGYRLDMIMPADAPRLAYLSRGKKIVELTTDPQSEIRNPKSTGRAGMEYRDLIPDRLAGLLIASHIRIVNGGEVPDYVHYHKLFFQMIYCRGGWVRVVYEDQGPPFTMNSGDCVLQPPEIRHRVLEASDGAEVIEVSSPAVHETWVDHEMLLPTATVNSDREFGGQRFMRHVAADAIWIEHEGIQYRDTGIAGATKGRADARVMRLSAATEFSLDPGHTTFVFVLDGDIAVGDRTFQRSDSFVIAPERPHGKTIAAVSDSEFLQVTISPELVHFFLATSVPTEREP